MIERFYVDGVHSPLSNFWFCGTVIDGKEWQTLEHYYQAMKSNDESEQERVRGLPKPGSAKKYGRNLELRPDWEEVKLAVMRRGLHFKFTTTSPAGMYLLDTKDEYLQEGNNWGDRFWGVDGTGHNWLGVLLMARRAELRST